MGKRRKRKPKRKTERSKESKYDRTVLVGGQSEFKEPINRRTVANAMRKSLEKGTLYSLETLLSRVYGQPKQEIEAQVNVDRFDFE